MTESNPSDQTHHALYSLQNSLTSSSTTLQPSLNIALPPWGPWQIWQILIKIQEICRFSAVGRIILLGFLQLPCKLSVKFGSKSLIYKSLFLKIPLTFCLSVPILSTVYPYPPSLSLSFHPPFFIGSVCYVWIYTIFVRQSELECIWFSG